MNFFFFHCVQRTTLNTSAPFKSSTIAALISLGCLTSFFTGCASVKTNTKKSEHTQTGAASGNTAIQVSPRKLHLSTNSGLPTSGTIATEQLFSLVEKDPFRSLAQPEQEESRQWMKEQHDKTRRYLAGILHEDKKKSVLQEATEEGQASLPLDLDQRSIQRSGDKLFYFRAEPDQPSKILYIRDHIEEQNDRILIDLKKQSTLWPEHSVIQQFRVSPNGRWVAILVRTLKNTGQNETDNTDASLDLFQIIVIDTQKGQSVLRPVQGVQPQSFLAWRPDSQAIFFSKRNTDKQQEVVMRLLSGPSAGKTFSILGPGHGLNEELEADEQLAIFTSPISPYTLAVLQSSKGIRVLSTLSAELSGQNKTATSTSKVGETPAMTTIPVIWSPLIGWQDHVLSLDIRGDWLYAITQRSKPNGELVRLRLSEPRWQEADLLIPATDNIILHQLGAARDALYIEQKENGISQLLKLPYNARYQNSGELQPLPDQVTHVKPTPKPVEQILPTPQDMAKTAPVLPEPVAATSPILPKVTPTKGLEGSDHTGESSVPESNQARSNAIKLQENSASSTSARSTSKHTARYKRTHHQSTRHQSTKNQTRKSHRHSVETDSTVATTATSPAQQPSEKKGHKSRTHNAKVSQHPVTPQHQTPTHTISSKASRHEKTGAHISTHSTKTPITKKAASSRSKHQHSSRNQVAPPTLKQSIMPHSAKTSTIASSTTHRRHHHPIDMATPEVERRRVRIKSRVIRLALPTPVPNTKDIALPVQGSIQQLITDPLESGVLARMNNWTHPLEIVLVDGKQPARLISNKGFSKEDQDRTSSTLSAIQDVSPQTTRLLVPADESAHPTMMPLTLITSANLPAKSNAASSSSSPKPLLLILDTQGQALTSPKFQSDSMSWIKKGGTVAIVDLFPTPLAEQQWLDHAKLVPDSQYVVRLQTILDYLYGERISQPDRLVISGNGANASLLAQFLVQHPNECRAAVLEAGVYDSLHWEEEKTNSANPTWNDEALKTIPAETLQKKFKTSSYYQIHDGTHYPSVLILGNSHREHVVQAARFSARLQKAHTDNEAYFYSAGRPLGEEVKFVFLWNEIEDVATH